MFLRGGVHADPRHAPLLLHVEPRTLPCPPNLITAHCPVPMPHATRRTRLHHAVQPHTLICPDGFRICCVRREMILRRPHEFKIATLQDIRNLFPPDWNPFYAGFGNRDTDEISYREVGVPPSRIFIINPKVLCAVCCV